MSEQNSVMQPEIQPEAQPETQPQIQPEAVSQEPLMLQEELIPEPMPQNLGAISGEIKDPLGSGEIEVDDPYEGRIKINIPEPDQQTVAMRSYFHGLAGMGLGLGRWMEAGIRTGYEEATNDYAFELSNLAALYRKNLAIVDATVDAGFAEYPGTALSGNMAGEMTAMLVGGAAARVASKSATWAIAKSGNVIHNTLNTVKGQAAMGAVQGALESRNLEDVAGNAAFGGSLGAVGGAISNKISTGSMSGTSSMDAAKAVKAAKAMGDLDTVAKALNIDLNLQNLTPQTKDAFKEADRLGYSNIKEFLFNVSEFPDGSPLIGPDSTPATIYEKVSKTKAGIAAGMNANAADLDSYLNSNIPNWTGISTNKIQSSIDLTLKPFMSDLTESGKGDLKQLVKTLSGLDDAVLEKTGQAEARMSFSDLNELRYKAKQIVGRSIKEKSMADSLYNSFSKKIDDLYESQMRMWSPKTESGEIPQHLKNHLALKKEYADYSGLARVFESQFNRVTTSSVIEETSNGVTSHFANAAKEAIMNRPGGVSYQLGMALMNSVSKTNVVDPLISHTRQLKSLNKIANALQNNPAKFQKLAASAVQAATHSSFEFQNALGLIESYIDFDTNKVARTFESVGANLPQILNVMNAEAPDVYEKMQIALERQDRDMIASTISEFSRTPAGRKVVAPGLGFDGKVTNAADFMEVQAQIKNSTMDNRAKMRAMERLRDFNEVPVFTKPHDFIKETTNARRHKSGQKIPAL